jgi:BlaI family transcriptional regulator, penicillinase repressor
MTLNNALSELQLALMRVLWDLGESSAAEVHRALNRTRPLAITTVATLLGRLEKRQLVSHRNEGRAFVYRARVSEHDVRRKMLSGLVRNLFRGDPTELVEHLLSERDVSPGDIARIQELIEGAARPAAKKSKEVRKSGR